MNSSSSLGSKGYFDSIIKNKKKQQLSINESKSKTEIVKQRDGSILVIDYDQFNKLISKKEYATDMDFQNDDTLMFDDTANFINNQNDDSEVQQFENLIEDLNKQDDLNTIKTRQKILQQERKMQAQNNSLKLKQFKSQNDLHNIIE